MLLRDLAMDACAIINVMKSLIADRTLVRIDPRPQVTAVNEGECRGKPETAAALEEFIREELLRRSEIVIDSQDLLDFVERHELGAGESEAILACMASETHLWSDDKRARNVGTDLLGEPRVVGTIGILKALVGAQDLAIETAWDAYNSMRDAGARLPPITQEFFA